MVDRLVAWSIIFAGHVKGGALGRRRRCLEREMRIAETKDKLGLDKPVLHPNIWRFSAALGARGR